MQLIILTSYLLPSLLHVFYHWKDNFALCCYRIFLKKFALSCCVEMMFFKFIFECVF